MSKTPPFLPEKLEFKGNWDKYLKKLYGVFEHDFKRHTATHQGLPIDFTRKVLADGDGKEEGFWHVVSIFDESSGNRVIDFDRANRLPWARPTFESPTRTEIKVFDYDHGSKDIGIRRYVWLEDYDYALILKRRGNKYFWVTAFYVKKWKKKDLYRRYRNRD